MRSSLDKVYLVAEIEEAAKAISGKIEWLASHGGLIRLDAICLGFSMDQRGSCNQAKPKKNPKGLKIKKTSNKEKRSQVREVQ